MLAALSCLGAAGAIGLPQWLSRSARAMDGAEPEKPARFMIILGAWGGASIVDSFLAVRNSESDAWLNVNTFADEEVVDVPDSPFRAVVRQRDSIGFLPAPYASRQQQFAEKHKQDMMVVTLRNSSVNHVIAQKRSINGNRAWRGRTLQEMVALEHGQHLLLPNVNAGADGYAEDGDDPSLPLNVYAERVIDASRWALGLDGAKGIKGAPSRELIQMARQLRNEHLDPESVFARTFRDSQDLTQWFAMRERQPRLEEQDLFTKLSILGDEEPLAEFGLASTPDAALVRARFPELAFNPLESQAALAFLLIKYGISTSVTISPGPEVFVRPTGTAELLNLPAAFDNSHLQHRDCQAFMWSRMLGVIDGLIDLLRAEVYDEATGESLWDRTLIYMATDFGRSRRRDNGSETFGTGHDLNNGVLLVSPLVNGNTVLGGVDPSSTMTYGFDPTTGDPDPSREFSEAELYAGILQALDVSTEGSGLPVVSAMRRRG